MVLDSASQRDDQGLYFGPISLSSYVVSNGRHEGLEVSYPQVGAGLTIMVFLGVLEPGKSGSKSPNYKRRYYPDKVDSVSEADIIRFRRSRGTDSPMPPGR